MTQQAQLQEITYDLATSPGYARDGICFAACGSGLYRSQDGGVTWHSAYDALNLESPLPTLAVAVSPAFETDRTVFAGAAGGILRSFDGGNTWLTALLPAPPPVVSALAISPGYADDGVLLASTVEDGVFRSADRGSRWEAWNFGLLDLDILCLAISPGFARDDTLFVGTETGIFRSTNGGRAWREAGFPTDYAPVLSLAMSPGYTQDGVLFAGTESSGLFHSGDQGRTWERVGQHAIVDVANAVLLSPEFPRRPHLLVLIDDALLVSRDGGASWSGWKAGIQFEQEASCVVAPQGLDPGAPLLVGLAQGGVLKV